MKKAIISVLVVLSTFVLSTAIYSEDATIISVNGKLEVNRNNQWIEIGPKEVIKEGEVLSTGFKSDATIRYQGALMKMGPLTRITVEKLSTTSSKDNVSIYLNTGALRSTVNRTENKKISYIVRNPVAVAAVRGTDYTLLGDGTAYVYDGGVALSPASTFSAREHGIANPADGQEGATDEEVRQFDGVMPAEGESNPFTNIADVAPNEKNAILVTAGQQASFSPDQQMPNSARDMNAVRNDQINSMQNIASDAEGMREGGARKDNTNNSAQSQSPSSKGKLVINVTIKE